MSDSTDARGAGEGLKVVRAQPGVITADARLEFVRFARAEIEQSIPDRFQAQVARHPERLAVKHAGTAWTYTTLNQTANRVAHALLELRGEGEEPVALALEQGVWLVAAILGVLKAGKIYVPLDPDDPPQRWCERIEESGAPVVLVGAATRQPAIEAAPSGTVVLDLDAIDPGMPTHDPGLILSPDRIAYIYYTSGSTGRPKGVYDTHRNVLHNVMRYTNNLAIGVEDRLTLLQGPAFSGAVSSLFCALLNGAASFPFDVPKQGADRIAAWLQHESITIYHSVPALFRVVAESGLSWPALRLIRLEGDQASRRDTERFVNLLGSRFQPACRLVNGLGATECGIVRQFFLDQDTPPITGVVPIGYSLEDMEARVLDESGTEVNPGQVGEITIYSRYLAQGYWRRPDLTTAAFGVDPTQPGVRVYRTGDLGRLRMDGCLEHLGRRDFQPRIRGQRVELSLIEAALLGLEGVREAAVAAREDAREGGDAEPRLVAYIVPNVQPVPDVHFIRQHLARHLPDHAIPGAYVMLEALPLNANGKLDRRALPAPGPERPDLGARFIAPATLLEIELARIWEELLGVHPVGLRDDFFDLGGHSLLAARLVTEIRRRLGRQVGLTALLEQPTIEHLVAVMQQDASDLLEPIVPVQPQGKQAPLFFLHGDYLSGGFYCTSLARHLGPDQPLYALPPCGLDGGAVPDSYAGMAARHLEAIRRVQPHGPYRLGGQCNGGLIAYEIARQLEAQGERVEHLVLIAADAANARVAWLRPWLRLLGRLTGASPEGQRHQFVHWRQILTQVDRLPPLGRVQFILERMGRVPRQLRDLFRPRGGDAATDQAMMGPHQRLAQAYSRIDDLHTPGPYGGRVCLLWPSSDPVPASVAARWWRGAAARVDLHVIPGDHSSFLTTHLASTAAAITNVLNQP
jgi:amino acid adenylation domain-containing protein